MGLSVIFTRKGIVKEIKEGMTCIAVGQLCLYSADPAKMGEQVKVAIRPENIMIARKKPDDISARNVIKATLDSIETSDNVHSLSLSAKSLKFNILITENALHEMVLKPGDTVYALIKCTHMRIV